MAPAIIPKVSTIREFIFGLRTMPLENATLSSTYNPAEESAVKTEKPKRARDTIRIEDDVVETVINCLILE